MLSHIHLCICRNNRPANYAAETGPVSTITNKKSSHTPSLPPAFAQGYGAQVTPLFHPPSHKVTARRLLHHSHPPSSRNRGTTAARSLRYSTTPRTPQRAVPTIHRSRFAPKATDVTSSFRLPGPASFLASLRRQAS